MCKGSRKVVIRSYSPHLHAVNHCDHLGYPVEALAFTSPFSVTAWPSGRGEGREAKAQGTGAYLVEQGDQGPLVPTLDPTLFIVFSIFRLY